MYIPESFRVSDQSTLFDFVERHSFGLLVSRHNGESFASHLPFLLDRTLPDGRLIGHMARANPQWQQADGQDVLAIFSGPHAYVSPTWYESDDVVPTWNYVAVHAYGTLHAIHDEAALLDILRRTVARYEKPQPRPWPFDAGSEFACRMAQAVVGFRIDVRRIEGKWKLNQNHPQERRERVVQALRATGGHDAQAIAALMEQGATG